MVCVLSGGNNDVSRYAEVVERALIYEERKHYFLIEFPQEPGALRRFLDEVLGPNEDITLFEYVKRSNRETGPALVGIELASPDDLPSLLKRMEAARPGSNGSTPPVRSFDSCCEPRESRRPIVGVGYGDQLRSIADTGGRAGSQQASVAIRRDSLSNMPSMRSFDIIPHCAEFEPSVGHRDDGPGAALAVR